MLTNFFQSFRRLWSSSTITEKWEFREKRILASVIPHVADTSHGEQYDIVVIDESIELTDINLCESIPPQNLVIAALKDLNDNESVCIKFNGNFLTS